MRRLPAPHNSRNKDRFSSSSGGGETREALERPCWPMWGFSWSPRGRPTTALKSPAMTMGPEASRFQTSSNRSE
eukprot:5693373-Alexandrium_andersonii.AAC.1